AYKLSEFGRRSTRGLRTTICKALTDLWACKRPADGVVQAGDNLSRRATLRCKAHPIFDHQIRKALLHDCRHVRQASDPLWSRHGNGAKPARGNELDDGGAGDEIELGRAIEKVDHALLDLLRRHMCCTHSGLKREHLSNEMSWRSEAPGRKVQTVRLV